MIKLERGTNKVCSRPRRFLVRLSSSYEWGEGNKKEDFGSEKHVSRYSFTSLEVVALKTAISHSFSSAAERSESTCSVEHCYLFEAAQKY